MRAPCLLCGGPVRSLTERKGLAVYACEKCGLRMGHALGSHTSSSDTVVATDPNHFKFLREQEAAYEAVVGSLLRARLPIYEQHLGRPARLWLEVGPGNGVLSNVLSAMGRRWTGVEYDADMAQLMRSRGKNVVHADFTAVDPKAIMGDEEKANGGFDIAVFSQVLEHVRAPAVFLRNIFAALRPGGIVHLDVPNDDGITATIRRLNPFAGSHGEIVPPHHMIAYSGSTLRMALEQAGFSIIDVFGCAYDDPRFGLTHARMSTSRKLKLVWSLSRTLNRGGNLVALARKPA